MLSINFPLFLFPDGHWNLAPASFCYVKVPNTTPKNSCLRDASKKFFLIKRKNTVLVSEIHSDKLECRLCRPGLHLTSAPLYWSESVSPHGLGWTENYTAGSGIKVALIRECWKHLVSILIKIKVITPGLTDGLTQQFWE